MEIPTVDQGERGGTNRRRRQCGYHPKGRGDDQHACRVPGRIGADMEEPLAEEGCESIYRSLPLFRPNANAYRPSSTGCCSLLCSVGYLSCFSNGSVEVLPVSRLIIHHIHPVRPALISQVLKIGSVSLSSPPLPFPSSVCSMQQPSSLETETCTSTKPSHPLDIHPRLSFSSTP